MHRYYKQDRRLEASAKDNEQRTRVLAGRAERSKHLNRRVTCRICEELSYGFRDRTDICDDCLFKIWNAEDVAIAAHAAADGDGLVAVRAPAQSHWQEYPHMATNHDQCPARGAVRPTA